MRYGSVCSGIEAATVAWHPLGWEAQWFAEISRFPAKVLNHHYPGVKNYGDFTTIDKDAAPIGLLVGGTPCQSFSVAGQRAGLDDARGNLALEFLRLAHRTRPRWLIWENVPGVLFADKGRDFGTIVGAMAKLGYGFAYRVLDAQNFGVPQRRRRVFVVGYLGDWRRAAAVLFERTCLSRDLAPGRGKAGRATAASGSCSPNSSGQLNPGEVISFDERMITLPRAKSKADPGAPTPTLLKRCDMAIAYRVKQKTAVRRLTPLEWERLQGFPDGYTAIPGASDRQRREAIGNSMAVPVMRWIGERIHYVDRL